MENQESEPREIPKTLEELAEQYSQEVADFFGIEEIPFELKILSSRPDINEIKGYQTSDWLVGFTAGETVYMLNKEKWEQESSHQPEQFEDTLKQEIAHIYFRKYKGNSLPSWLNEGTCEFIANQTYLCNYNKDAITIDELDSYHNYDPRRGSHAIGGFMVYQIVNDYGKDTLLELIKISDRETRYQKLREMFTWLK